MTSPATTAAAQPFYATVDEVCAFDCTADCKDPDTYFESHPTRVIRSVAGAYRECSSERFSRFAYRYFVRQPGRAHLLRIQYPDDKKRTMCVLNGVSYDISTGIGTGRECPISNTMRWHEIVFWPRQTENYVMLASWDPAAPAAAARIEVHTLDETVWSDHDNAPTCGGRRIGMQWEDPGGRYQTLGARRCIEWPQRVADYCASIGQNLVVHPLTWYWGCLYPSEIEACDYLEGLLADDGEMFFNAKSGGEDWVPQVIECLAQRNVDFMGVFHAYRFHNLMKQAQSDPTMRNVSRDGVTQLTVNDWTRTWTRFNMGPMADSEGYRDDPATVKGTAYECTDGMRSMPQEHLGEPMGRVENSGAGPIFNFLHPGVEAHLLRLMEELRARYGRYDNFKGLTIPLWAGTMIWHAGMHLGYDDLTFAAFEQDTGVTTGIDPNGTNRFRQRHAWLQQHGSDAFCRWRCGRVFALLQKMHRALAGQRDDVRLIVQIDREPLLGQLICGDLPLLYHDESVQLHKLGSLTDILFKGGVDIAMFQPDSGVELELQLDPYRDRALDGKFGDIPSSDTLRSHDFLDLDLNASIAREPSRNIFVFNCYYESGSYVIGRKPAQVSPEVMASGTGIEDLYRLYLVFNHPIWPWHEHEFTTCPGVPNVGRHFLEPYAHAVGNFDAKQITFGGLTVGTLGHEKELAEFSSVYRRLPVDPFEQTPSDSDAVVCRQLVHGDKRYVYLVNMEFHPMSVAVAFNQPGLVLNPLGNTPPLQTDAQSSVLVHLKPFELRAYTTRHDAQAIRCHVQPSKPMDERVQLAKNLLNQLEDDQHRSTSGAAWLRRMLEECLGSSRPARLRQVLRSTPARLVAAPSTGCQTTAQPAG